MATPAFTNLDGAYAFFSAYHTLTDSRETEGTPPTKGLDEETLEKAQQATLKLLENADMPRSFLTKLQKEVRFFSEKADLSVLDSKISDLLKIRLTRSNKPLPAENDLRQFCLDKIDLLLSYIFYQFNLYLFEGWNVTVRKADLQKLENELAKRGPTPGIQLSPDQALFKENVAKFDKQAERVREAFHAFGGERISLKTADNVSLDGFYLSAISFRKELKGAGVERFSLTSEEFPFKEGLVIASDSPYLQTLKHNFTNNGFAFVPVKGTNKTLIIDEKWPQFSSGITLSSEDKLTETTLETTTPGGTVILGGGTLSTYELENNKGEVLAFLAKGLNVVVFNYRGYGQSTGFPTTQGTYKDVEAVYQFVKKEIQPEDKKIIAKGYCLSGHIMAELARTHPHINLFLDRTTSTLYSFIKHSLTNLLKGHFQSVDKSGFLAHFISSLLTPLVWLLSPPYNTLQALKTIQGRVHILEAQDDLRIPEGTYEEMKHVMQTAGTESRLTHTLLPVQERMSALEPDATPHDLRWLDARKEHYEKPAEATEALDPSLLASRAEATSPASPHEGILFSIGMGEMLPKLASREYPGRESIDKFLDELHLLDGLVK